MNKLEKQIKENRDRFDGFEPSGEHHDRFKAKLASTNLYAAKATLYYRIPDWLKIAALIAVVAVSSILVFEQAQRYYARGHESFKEILPGEYFEASVYYTSQIKQKYSEIDRLNSSDPERNEILYTELREMDRMFRSLLKDLQTNPSDERVLSAMITHYQLKLDVMGQIINQLEEANQINSTYSNHEKTDV